MSLWALISRNVVFLEAGARTADLIRFRNLLDDDKRLNCGAMQAGVSDHDPAMDGLVPRGDSELRRQLGALSEQVVRLRSDLEEQRAKADVALHEAADIPELTEARCVDLEAENQHLQARLAYARRGHRDVATELRAKIAKLEEELVLADAVQEQSSKGMDTFAEDSVAAPGCPPTLTPVIPSAMGRGPTLCQGSGRAGAERGQGQARHTVFDDDVDGSYATGGKHVDPVAKMGVDRRMDEPHDNCRVNGEVVTVRQVDVAERHGPHRG